MAKIQHLSPPPISSYAVLIIVDTLAHRREYRPRDLSFSAHTRNFAYDLRERIKRRAVNYSCPRIYRSYRKASPYVALNARR